MGNFICILLDIRTRFVPACTSTLDCDIHVMTIVAFCFDDDARDSPTFCHGIDTTTARRIFLIALHSKGERSKSDRGRYWDGLSTLVCICFFLHHVGRGLGSTPADHGQLWGRLYDKQGPTGIMHHELSRSLNHWYLLV
jgi:hypothetical protein